MAIHENKKREYLKVAVINTALQINIKQDLQQRFINVISNLTQTHIQLLNLFSKNEMIKIDSYEKLYALCEDDFPWPISIGELFNTDMQLAFRAYP